MEIFVTPKWLYVLLGFKIDGIVWKLTSPFLKILRKEEL